MALIIYLLLSLLVGALAMGQRGGFALYFVLSMIMSPLVGLLILILAMPKEP